ETGLPALARARSVRRRIPAVRRRHAALEQTRAWARANHLRAGQGQPLRALQGPEPLVHLGGNAFPVTTMDDRRWTISASSIVYGLLSKKYRYSLATMYY